MENVMDMAHGPLMGQLFAKLGGSLHENPESVKRGFETAVPASIAGLAERASTQEGAQTLLSTLRRGDYPHVDPAELGRPSGDQMSTENVARSGEGFLSRLFGGKENVVVDALAGIAGLSRASASKLLGLAAPLVLNFVGKEATSRNLDARGLQGFLSEQRRQVAPALPGPLSRLFPSSAGAVPGQKRSAWLLAVLAAVAVLGLLFWRRAAHQAMVRTAAPQAQVVEVFRPVALYMGTGIAPFTKAIETGPLPQRFILSDLTFRTDSAEIEPASARILNDVARVLMAHPTARVRVEGHTDNTGPGDVNRKLSQARADATRAYLMSQGIGGERIQAMGFGPDTPLASNDTAAGRAENRRTEIVALAR